MRGVISERQAFVEHFRHAWLPARSFSIPISVSMMAK
jgi:hypothetical protein